MNQKYAFLQALIVAIVIFSAGLFLGIYFENLRVQNTQDNLYQSDIDLNDFQAASQLAFHSNLSCDKITQKSVYFADQIYSEMIRLEKEDSSNRLTERFLPVHRRYDLLRTILWKDIIENKALCKSNLNTVIYMYNYSNPSLDLKGIQSTISNYIGDLKNKYGDNIILIPIAADTELDFVDLMREKYNLTTIPVVLVNEQYKVDNLDYLKTIEEHLNK
ncbi:MAG: hypothetical protein AABX17_00610 [Nanoarchaeota archaeon]